MSVAPVEAKSKFKGAESELKTDLKDLRTMLAKIKEADAERMNRMSEMAAQLRIDAVQFYKHVSKKHTPRESETAVEKLERKSHAQLRKLKNEVKAEQKLQVHEEQIRRISTVEELLSADIAKLDQNFDPKTHSRTQSLQTVEKFQTNTAKHLSSLNGEKLDAPVKSLLGKISHAIKDMVSAAKQFVASVASKLTSGFFGSKHKQVEPESPRHSFQQLDSPRSHKR